MTTTACAEDWREMYNKAAREAREWRENFNALQRALVGETGASGIEVAHALRKNAERYLWLRAQHWSTAELCVVMDPKDAVKLGRTCPSGEYLDIAVDDAMLIGRAVGAA